MENEEKGTKEFKATSPRLETFGKALLNWLEQYKDEEFDTKEKGLDIVLLANDKKYDEAMSYWFGYKDDIRDSILQAINHGIGDPAKDRTSFELFNGFAEYFARVFAEHPDYYDLFKENVEYYKKDIEENKEDKKEE